MEKILEGILKKKKKKSNQPKEMAQAVRRTVGLVEDQGLVPGSQTAAHNCPSLQFAES